jgi:type 1 glutamine amidotransferase
MRTAITLALALIAVTARAADTKIVLVPGHQSHGPGDHEFHAGLKLLDPCLDKVPGIRSVYLEPADMVPGEGWPKDEKDFDGARAVVFFMDGGGNHPAIQGDRIKTLRKLADQGVGLVFMHYAVEVPKGTPGDNFLDLIGGYYETGYSTNPHWVAEIKQLPDHPITRGVKPFAVRDEWYYNIRFRPEMKGVAPILVAKPDDEARAGKTSSPRGPYEHIVANKGRDEVLAWAIERPDGGRGFGFTGAHAHKNWGDPNFRKVVLNAILWTAKVEVPSQGVECEVSEEALKQNLDPKGR